MVSYSRTVLKGELWLPILAAFSHVDIIHLAFDLNILISLFTVELSLGSMVYIEVFAEIFLLTVAAQMSVYWVFGRGLSAAMTHNLKSLGITPYLVGMLVMNAQREEYFEFILFKGLHLYSTNAPLIMYILASCLAKEASLLAHIAAGYAGWAVGIGALSFLHGYWFVCVSIWLVVALMVSLRETTFLASYLGCIRVKSWPPWVEGDVQAERELSSSSNNNTTATVAQEDSTDEGASANARVQPRIRTQVNDEPYVQWVAASRIALDLARDQAEVEMAESKESDTVVDEAAASGETKERHNSNSFDFEEVTAEMDVGENDEEALLLGRAGGESKSMGREASGLYPRLGRRLSGMQHRRRSVESSSESSYNSLDNLI